VFIISAEKENSDEKVSTHENGNRKTISMTMTSYLAVSRSTAEGKEDDSDSDFLFYQLAEESERYNSSSIILIQGNLSENEVKSKRRIPTIKMKLLDLFHHFSMA
jgi:hypothetical protein